MCKHFVDVGDIQFIPSSFEWTLRRKMLNENSQERRNIKRESDNKMGKKWRKSFFSRYHIKDTRKNEKSELRVFQNYNSNVYNEIFSFFLSVSIWSLL